MRKSDGTWRMTVDYRELNKVTLPIHVAIPNIASLMDMLSGEIKTYHCVLDLANAFFSIPIAEELQDQFVFMWGGRQWSFQVLPQGYVHSPTYCHNLVERDLADWKKPDDVNLYHYTDDVPLTSNSLEAVGQAADSLTAYLQQRGWAINPQKVQGPGLSVKFLGVVWSGKTKVLPGAVIDKVQAFPVPTTSKQLQEFLGILGYWCSFYTSPGAAAKATVQTHKKGAAMGLGENSTGCFPTGKTGS